MARNSPLKTKQIREALEPKEPKNANDEGAKEGDSIGAYEAKRLKTAKRA
jgi:hypothetical protein